MLKRCLKDRPGFLPQPVSLKVQWLSVSSDMLVSALSYAACRGKCFATNLLWSFVLMMAVVVGGRGVANTSSV